MNRAAVSGAIESNISFTTDAVGPEALTMQRSSSINNMRIPTSPMSFSSNSVNMPGSLILDGPASMQHLPQQQQAGQGSVPMRENDYSHVDKKPILDVKQEDMLQQQIFQQLIQRQDPTGRNPHLQALLQQQRLRHQQQILQSMSPSQRLQLQQQQQLRQVQQGTQQIPPNLRPYEVGVCARKLMMYLYHLQQRPAENCITYWRKFVAEYFSPRAKQRLCLSQYESAGHHALGMFPQAAPVYTRKEKARETEKLAGKEDHSKSTEKKKEVELENNRLSGLDMSDNELNDISKEEMDKFKDCNG